MKKCEKSKYSLKNLKINLKWNIMKYLPLNFYVSKI